MCARFDAVLLLQILLINLLLDNMSCDIVFSYIMNVNWSSNSNNVLTTPSVCSQRLSDNNNVVYISISM